MKRRIATLFGIAVICGLITIPVLANKAENKIRHAMKVAAERAPEVPLFLYAATINPEEDQDC
jgi:hypothetical protein